MLSAQGDEDQLGLAEIDEIVGVERHGGEHLLIVEVDDVAPLPGEEVEAVVLLAVADFRMVFRGDF